ncbi:hypothetical protein Zmor_002585 [Zophobas morio]|uniref:Uncharacterized protein n=1 Tax=Zophobas morio TaxID=2755281 RepID=A0AA38J1B4_9CUCU|nr:hypothetical protein Zmor_002585 [Zophobas morio]
MMAFIRVIALALALAGSSWSSHPSESARNQYGAREDRPQPQLLTEATDHLPEVLPSQQAGVAASKQATAAPDLQVGCGDGFIHENSHKSEVDKAPSKPRRKRSYTPWSGRVVYSVPYPSISVWRPPVYQLQRPYFIPIYGYEGRVPIYYPPQPLPVNPGVPKDNPPFKGPTYLPPTETTPKFTDRFNGGDNGDDMNVWDAVDNGGVTQRPPQGLTTQVTPTRRTRPPGFPKTPPLVHNPTDPEGFPAANEGVTMPPPTPPRPTRPTAPTRPTQPAPPEPSRCVWAIISCCSSSNDISYDCFDQRGCPGAFWDTNPCDSEFSRAAIAAALNYYNK